MIRITVERLWKSPWMGLWWGSVHVIALGIWFVTESPTAVGVAALALGYVLVWQSYNDSEDFDE